MILLILNVQVYYRDFLRRLREYGVAELGEFPWEKEEGEEEERKQVDASGEW